MKKVYYSFGLDNFLFTKKVNTQEAITKYLEYKGVVNFTYINTNRVQKLIDTNWSEFATFIDKAIRNKELAGQPISASNGYWNRQRERSEVIKSEVTTCTPEELQMYNVIKSYDDNKCLSRTASFLNKRDIKLPPNDKEAVSRICKILPKLKFILTLDCKEELINYLKNYERSEI